MTVLILIIWWPLPWGSNRGAAMAAAGLITWLLLAGWSWLWARGRVRMPRSAPRLRWAMILWLAWLGWVALQLLPLPPELLAELSPAAAAVHAAVAEFGGRPAQTLSIAPGATVDRLLLSVTYFGWYWLVLVLLSSRARMQALLWAIVIGALAQALYGASMTLSGLEYGFFEKKDGAIGTATGTFINRNHFAAYLGLGLAAGIGLLLADLRGWQWRGWRQTLAGLLDLALSGTALLRVFLAVMVIGLVLSRSRMGNLAFFAALSVVGSIYVLVRHREWFLRSTVLFLSLILIDLWIVSSWFGLEQVMERIEATDVEAEQRTIAFRDFVPLLQTYRITGAGLGSFADAYSPFRGSGIYRLFDHAHNDYVEFFVETGAVGAGLLALLVLLHLGHALRLLAAREGRLRGGFAFALLMSTVALGIHAGVEFNLQIPAIVATWLAIMAGALRASPRAGPRRPRPS